jgi:hypothetical protein
MSFEVHAAGNVHVFDSFECAIHRLAPTCEHCQCQIIGHGVEVDGHFFCCAHCARASGTDRGDEVRDAVGGHPD